MAIIKGNIIILWGSVHLFRTFRLQHEIKCTFFIVIEKVKMTKKIFKKYSRSMRELVLEPVYRSLPPAELLY